MSTRRKFYSYEEALAASAQIGDLTVVGYVWRKTPSSARWIYTTTLTARPYPSTAQFMVAYVEQVEVP